MEFIGVDADWKQDALWGFGLGALVIMLNWLIPQFTIGFPTLPASTLGEKVFIICILAPVAEEFLFRGILLGILRNFMPNMVANTAQASAFALYHMNAYAAAFSLQGIVAASGAFIAAGIFGMLAGGITLWRNSLLPGILLHMIFNAFLMTQYLVMVA